MGDSGALFDEDSATLFIFGVFPRNPGSIGTRIIEKKKTFCKMLEYCQKAVSHRKNLEGEMEYLFDRGCLEWAVAKTEDECMAVAEYWTKSPQVRVVDDARPVRLMRGEISDLDKEQMSDFDKMKLAFCTGMQRYRVNCGYPAHIKPIMEFIETLVKNTTLRGPFLVITPDSSSAWRDWLCRSTFLVCLDTGDDAERAEILMTHAFVTKDDDGGVQSGCYRYHVVFAPLSIVVGNTVLFAKHKWVAVASPVASLCSMDAMFHIDCTEDVEFPMIPTRSRTYAGVRQQTMSKIEIPRPLFDQTPAVITFFPV